MLRALKKIRRLSPEDKKLLVPLALRLIYARILTRFISYERWNRVLAPKLKGKMGPVTPLDTERLAKLTEALARRIPGTYTCLPQAVAGCWTLRKYGVDGIIRVGVRRNKDAEFTAHAWVEVNDKVVIGEFDNDQGVAAFSHLMDINPNGTSND